MQSFKVLWIIVLVVFIALYVGWTSLTASYFTAGMEQSIFLPVTINFLYVINN